MYKESVNFIKKYKKCRLYNLRDYNENIWVLIKSMSGKKIYINRNWKGLRVIFVYNIIN